MKQKQSRPDVLTRELAVTIFRLYFFPPLRDKEKKRKLQGFCVDYQARRDLWDHMIEDFIQMGRVYPERARNWDYPEMCKGDYAKEVI